MPTPAETLQALLNGPALEAPAGASYQFDNPPNMNTMFSVLGVFLSLSLISFCVRIYTKWTIHYSLVKEDCKQMSINSCLSYNCFHRFFVPRLGTALLILPRCDLTCVAAVHSLWCYSSQACIRRCWGSSVAYTSKESKATTLRK